MTIPSGQGGHTHDVSIKYNSAGVQEWLRTLDGGGSDVAVAITTDEAGNVYMTGSSAGGLYSMTAKYNAAGDRLWVQSFTTIGEGDAGVEHARHPGVQDGAVVGTVVHAAGGGSSGDAAEREPAADVDTTEIGDRVQPADGVPGRE